MLVLIAFVAQKTFQEGLGISCCSGTLTPPPGSKTHLASSDDAWKKTAVPTAVATKTTQTEFEAACCAAVATCASTGSQCGADQTAHLNDFWKIEAMEGTE